jgi:hypothetical protein
VKNNSKTEISSTTDQREKLRIPLTEISTHPFAANFFPRQKVDVKSRLVDGELVILDRNGGLVHQLNRTATYIWERCNGEHSIGEIGTQVCEMFEIDRETALRDVIESVRQLLKVGLLQP